MLNCDSLKTVTLFEFFLNDYSMSYIAQLNDKIIDSATQITKFDDKLTLIYGKKDYKWTEGQTDSMTFIDSIALVKTSDNDLVFIR